MKHVDVELEGINKDIRKAKSDTFIANILSVTALSLSAIALMIRLLS